jgi:PTS system mannose-specific IID component
MGFLALSNWARVFWRSLHVQAVWNYKCMQNVGFAWLMGAILRATGFQDAEKRAREYHAGFVNTNPFLSSSVAGAVARMEREVDSGKMERSSLESLKGAVANALASKGDRLFWAGLRPLAVIVSSAAALFGAGMWSVVVMIVIFTPGQLALRVAGAQPAFRHGSMWLAKEFGKKIETTGLLVGCVLAACFGALSALIIAKSHDQSAEVLTTVIIFGVAGVISARLVKETTFVCACLLAAAAAVWGVLSW